MGFPYLSVRDRIGEVQNEIRYLRLILETEKDAEVKNLAADLMSKLMQRLKELKAL